MTITNLNRSIVCCFLLAVSFALVHPLPAHAGILDRLKEAARQAQSRQAAAEQGSATQQQTDANKGGQQTSTTQQTATSNGTDPDHPLHLTGEGHCHGHESATCMDYMDLMSQCMAPMKGYYAKLMAERIDWRLTHDNTLSARRRKNLEEDRVAFRGLAAKKSDDEPTLGGVAHSQRFLSDITDEDQIWVNAENTRFHNRIMNKCEGADHMGVGHRTEFIKGNNYGPTGDQAVAAYRKKHAAAAAAHTARESRQNAVTNCMASISVSGMRYKVMADMMEQKMRGMTLSAKQRSEWEEDIAAVRKAAAEGGTALPTVPGANPNRPLTRLSLQDQMELNNKYLAETRTAMANCQKLIPRN